MRVNLCGLQLLGVLTGQLSLHVEGKTFIVHSVEKEDGSGRRFNIYGKPSDANGYHQPMQSVFCQLTD